MPGYSETILTQNQHPGDSSVETVTGEKYKGDGYYGRSDGLHTVQINLNELVGTVKIQGTLATDPTEDDWFDTSVSHTATPTNNRTGSFMYNFTGNYVWVRAILTYTDGTLNSIKLNH